MFRKKFIIQFILLSFFVVISADFSIAQTTDNNEKLAKFEKSIEQGNYTSIERDLLNYLIANSKDARGFELLARVRFEQNRLNEAKSLYQKTLSLDPNLTSAKINFSIVNFQTGNTEQAISDLSEITDKDISDDSLRLNLANALALIGNCQNALIAVEKLPVKLKNSDALPLRAKCYLQTGEKQKVEPLIPSAKKLAKTNSKILVQFAEILSGAGMFKESADILKAVVSLEPKNAKVLILLAKSEIYTKDLTSAKLHLSQASSIDSNSPNLLFTKSLLESEQGNEAEALKLLESSLVLNPDSTVVLKQFVITAMRAKQTGKAVNTAEKLLRLKPEEPEFLYLYGAASLQNNSLQNAETYLKKFVEVRPKDSLGCLALGLTFAAQPDKLDEARNQMQNCLVIDPKNYEATYQLGLSYKNQGETAKAINYLEQTVKLSPNYALALRDLGTVYLQSGAEAKARTVLEKAFAINPKDADTNFQLSRLYNLIGETDLAKKHLKMFQDLRNKKTDGM